MAGSTSVTNGRLGGRPRGTRKTDAEKAAAKALRPALRERLLAKEEKFWARVEQIAFESFSDATSLSACNTYFEAFLAETVRLSLSWFPAYRVTRILGA